MVMGMLDVSKTTLLMHSFGMKCDKYQVEQWINKGKLKGIEIESKYLVEEDEVYNFLEDYRWSGTAYERGIDEKTKIARLLEEIDEFRQRIKELEDENRALREKLPPSKITPYF
jgi:hypothetical protein